MKRWIIMLRQEMDLIVVYCFINYEYCVSSNQVWYTFF